MADALKNFAYGTVLTAPSPATSGTSLVLNSGQGANFAVGNAVCWPSGVQPTSANAEIVRVTAISTDTLTITRAQESTTAQSIAVGWQVQQGVTAGLLAEYAPLSGATFTGAVTVPDLVASGLTGATSASRYVGATASGSPTSGTFALGDFVIDQTGKVWVCTTAGTPGTWTQVGGGALTAVGNTPLTADVSLAAGSSTNFLTTPSLAVGTWIVKVFALTIITSVGGSVDFYDSGGATYSKIPTGSVAASLTQTVANDAQTVVFEFIAVVTSAGPIFIYAKTDATTTATIKELSPVQGDYGTWCTAVKIA